MRINSYNLGELLRIGNVSGEDQQRWQMQGDGGGNFRVSTMTGLTNASNDI